MSLLTSLPNVLYNINPGSTDPKMILLKNIWRRGQIVSEYKASISLFTEYIVKNGETPETIALELYDDPFLNWTILIANDIVNYHDQWPRSAVDLEEYVTKKYTNPYAVKQYETTEVKNNAGDVLLSAGKVVPETFSFSYIEGTTPVTLSPKTSVTYYQYEQRLNDKKEKIQIIRPDLIQEFVAAYEKVLNRSNALTVGIANDDISM